jgi:agmatine/peptidylarginine deiminase
MGLLSFFRKVFSGEDDQQEKELDEARARHGIQVDKVEMDKKTSSAEQFGEQYDVWDDIKNIRSTFFFGTWASRKFHIVGEDKVKKQLEELEKKRQAGEQGK